MKKCVQLGVLLFVFNGCIIQKMARRTPTDGYVNIKEQDKKFVSNFNMENFNTSNNYNAATKTFVFEEVETADIKAMIQKNKYTLVVIWATWCVHCFNNIPTCVEWFDQQSNKGLNLVLVAQNYNIPVMTKELNEAGYRNQPYVLSNAYFGNEENKKQETAKQELGVSLNGHSTVPTQILFNQAGTPLYFHQGEIHNRDTIMNYLDK